MSTTQSTRKVVLGTVLAVVGLSGWAGAASPVPARQAVDLGRGNVAVAAPGQNRVYRLDSLGRATVLAGSGRVGFRGDGGRATLAMLNAPSALAVDAQGNLYIADTGNNRVRRLNASSGIITTVAGGGESDFEGSAATQARLSHPSGVAVDASGDLYIADTGNHRVRRVDASSEQITTVAGVGEPGLSGDGDLASGAALQGPTGLAFDSTSGRLLVADTGNHRVVSLETDGTLRALAGDGRQGFAGDGGPAVEARLSFPSGLSVDRTGNVLVADAGNHRVRRVDLSGQIGTIGDTTLGVVHPNDPMPSLKKKTGRIVVTSPATRNEWAVGSKRLIRWSHTLGKNALFVVELSRDGGLTWEPIGKQLSATAASASMTWVVTAPGTMTGLFRVRWTGNAAVVGTSAPVGIWYAD